MNNKKKELRTFYLLTFPPLFIFSLIILFFETDYSGLALFGFGYTFSLVAWTPRVAELVRTKKYRLSFLRLSYALSKGVVGVLPVRDNPYVGSAVRMILPALMMSLFIFIFQVRLEIYYVILGAFISEVLLHTLKRYISKDMVSFSV